MSNDSSMGAASTDSGSGGGKKKKKVKTLTSEQISRALRKKSIFIRNPEPNVTSKDSESKSNDGYPNSGSEESESNNKSKTSSTYKSNNSSGSTYETGGTIVNQYRRIACVRYVRPAGAGLFPGSNSGMPPPPPYCPYPYGCCWPYPYNPYGCPPAQNNTGSDNGNSNRPPIIIRAGGPAYRPYRKSDDYDYDDDRRRRDRDSHGSIDREYSGRRKGSRSPTRRSGRYSDDKVDYDRRKQEEYEDYLALKYGRYHDNPRDSRWTKELMLKRYLRHSGSDYSPRRSDHGKCTCRRHHHSRSRSRPVKVRRIKSRQIEHRSRSRRSVSKPRSVKKHQPSKKKSKIKHQHHHHSKPKKSKEVKKPKEKPIKAVESILSTRKSVKPINKEPEIVLLPSATQLPSVNTKRSPPSETLTTATTEPEPVEVTPIAIVEESVEKQKSISEEPEPEPKKSKSNSYSVSYSSSSSSTPPTSFKYLIDSHRPWTPKKVYTKVIKTTGTETQSTIPDTKKTTGTETQSTIPETKNTTELLTSQSSLPTSSKPGTYQESSKQTDSVQVPSRYPTTVASTSRTSSIDVKNMATSTASKKLDVPSSRSSYFQEPGDMKTDSVQVPSQYAASSRKSTKGLSEFSTDQSTVSHTATDNTNLTELYWGGVTQSTSTQITNPNANK